VERDIEVHLTVSPLGKRLLFDELDIRRVDQESLLGECGTGHSEGLTIYSDNDLGAAIASGSFLHDGMVIVPCSSNTLGAIASGVTHTLAQRAAAVALKERRKLILAHRESPISLIDIENMRRVTEAGAVVAPLSPGFYLRPDGVEDLIDFMAGKMLDLLGVGHDLATRWGETRTHLSN